MSETTTGTSPFTSPLGWSTHSATLATELHVSGYGMHTGRKVNVRILPWSEFNGLNGIIFRRINWHGTLAEAYVSPERWQRSPLCSSLVLHDKVIVRTVEHLLAALLMCEIDCALVELDAEEVPILDAGAAQWVERIRSCGRAELAAPKSFIKIQKNFSTAIQKARYTFSPNPGFHIRGITHEYDFPRMQWQATLTPQVFATEMAPARSFGHLRRALPAFLLGLISRQPVLQGIRHTPGAIIFNKQVIGGSLFPDEFVRHRLLDFIGDFAFLGAPLVGEFLVHKPSHNWNHCCLKELLAAKESWEAVQAVP